MQKFYLAKINEEECIGCTKCLEACPFDAIIGASQQMHTILKTECTGCKLCIDPCPVNCISLEEIKTPLFNREKIKQRKKERTDRLKKDAFAQIPLNQNEAKNKLLEILQRQSKTNR